MCLGGSAPHDNSGDIAAQQEAKRQANIKAGTSAINAAFDGSDKGINPASAYAPGTTYYNADGTRYSAGDQSAEDQWFAQQQGLAPDQAKAYAAQPDANSKSAYLVKIGKGTLTPQGQQMQRRNDQYGRDYGTRAQPVGYNPDFYTTPQEQALTDWQNQQAGEAAKGGKLFTGVQHSGGFDQPFYDKITKNYEDYYDPQLDQQYQNSLNSLTYQLGQQGILQSTEGNRQLALLKQSYDTNKQTIGNNALNAANTTKQNIAGQKNQLLAQASQAGDPSTLAAQAAEAVSSNSQPSIQYSPLGSVFANILGQGTNALSIQQGGLPGASYGGGGASYNTFVAPSAQAGASGGGHATLVQ